MNHLRFKQSDFFQILKLVSKADRIKLFIVSLIQIFLSFLDLIGVAFFGLIGSVTVAAISSTKVAGRTESVINFLGLGNYSSQLQVAILGDLIEGSVNKYLYPIIGVIVLVTLIPLLNGVYKERKSKK